MVMIVAGVGESFDELSLEIIAPSFEPTLLVLDCTTDVVELEVLAWAPSEMVTADEAVLSIATGCCPVALCGTMTAVFAKTGRRGTARNG